MPSRVRLHWAPFHQPARQQEILGSSTMSASQSGQPIVQHEQEYSAGPANGKNWPLLASFGPGPGRSHGPVFHDFQFHWQGAAAKWMVTDVLLPGILGAGKSGRCHGNGFIDPGSRQHFPSSQKWQSVWHTIGCQFTELLRPRH